MTAPTVTSYQVLELVEPAPISPTDQTAAPQPPAIPIDRAPAEPNRVPESRRRTFLAERCRETPCWLASLVLHLTCLVVLGSLMVPVARERVATLWVMMGSWSDDRAELRLPVVAFEGDDLRNRGDAAAADSNPPPILEAAEPPLPAEAELSSPVPNPLLTERASAEPESGEAVPREIVLAERRPDLEAPDYAADIPDAGSPESIAALNIRGAADDVVDRFIEYDIGRLRGEVGAAARRDFELLGPESVPALVRGLNKSAYIAASCPVGVLSTKLEREVGASRDPTLIRFAIENLGQGVRADAVHADRVYALRERLLKRFGRSIEYARTDLARHEFATAAEHVEAHEQLRTASLAELTRAISGSDPARSQAALAILDRRTQPMTLGQRLDLAAALVTRLRSSSLPERRAADRLLRKLAEGPLPPLRLDAPQTTTREWRDYWTRYQAEQVDGPKAERLYAMARLLEQRGRHSSAQQRYRDLIRDFPGAPAADRARKRLAQFAAQ